MELLKQVLGSAVVASMIVATIGGSWKIIQDRRRDRRIDERDAFDQLSEMRAAAETHILDFDVPMQEGVVQLRSVVNQMRLEQGKDPIAFPPLPKASPLFPNRRKDKP